MIKIVLSCIVLTISCSLNKIMQTLPTINEAYVFSSFNKAGTTASIRSAYNELKEKEGIKRKLSEEQLNKLNNIFKNIKHKKHMQQKIAGIEKGVELCYFNGCYFFILTRTRLIDISRSYEYDLTQEEYQEMNKIFES